MSAVVAKRQAIAVVGTVRDASTQKGLDNASIAVTVVGALGASAQSGADGRYVVPLAHVPQGASLTVTVRRLGYEMWKTTVPASGDTVRVDAMLRAANQHLASVVVTDAATRREVAGGRANSPLPAPSLQGKVAGMNVAAARAREADRRRDERRPRSVMDSSRSVDWNREQYDRILDNPFLGVRGNPRSTFSVDVDRASYGNVRRYITQGQLPPADAVRIEELVNYFAYDLAEPRDNAPVAITTEAMPAPWQTRHQLVRVALQARRIDTEKLPPSNLVFLIDVSGSMMSADKLPLVKQSLRLLVEQLRPQDQVALVVYAGAAGLALPSTSGDQKSRIMEAIERLEAGGSTAGGAGLELAYRTAREHFERGGNNRVILCTDGDFNVGPSSDAAMERLIESKRAEGTYLTVLGFGTGNYQDAKMEKIAKIGNGNYAYIDEIGEANKVLVKEMGGTLVTVANDVKLQIEFNPARVVAYRLIGYEDRILRDEDFRDDKKDAGDMGAGHSVTALYEIVPVGVKGTVTVRDADPLRYAQDADAPRRAVSDADELLHVSLRYKRPGESTSNLITKAVRAGSSRERASADLRFASAVASFGMLLRNSEHKGTSSATDVLALARGAEGEDKEGYRADFVRLVSRWQELSRNIATRPVPRER
jgi:Ca-activated chloride channel family protein